jgi:fumarate reductase flavoprotein subunit
METLVHDVLVIGGGAAGLRAAIAAAEATQPAGTPPLNIAIVSKVYPVRSHTVSAEGGAAAMLMEYDSFDLHAYDTIRGADYLADQDAVEVFVKEAPQEIIQMEHWGCPWNRDQEGHLLVRAFGGMSVERTVFASDKTGFYMLHTLFQTSLKYPQISRYDEWFVTSIVVQNGKALGVTALDLRTGDMRLITAKAIILSTGGGGRIFAFTTNGAICTGDGMALAYRAGAPLKDMEFVQFHPTGLPDTGILITEASRGEGGRLYNAKGERFLERYIPNRMEMGPRDIISRAIITELENGTGFGSARDGYVHLDLRHLGKKRLEERLPFVLELTRTYMGIDPVTQPIPVRPVVHYMMGGVHTDITGATPLDGLFACGETACVSINGSNRLGSNSLAECLVFGARAGATAAAYAVEQSPVTQVLSSLAEDESDRVRSRFLQGDGKTEKVAELRHDLQMTMEDGAGVFRTGDSLQQARNKLDELRQRSQRIAIQDTTKTFNVELIGALELDFMLDVAETILHSAHARHESRGAHVRLDYPERDDQNFLTHTLAYRTPDGPRLDSLPVTITQWQPEERKY